MSKFSVREFRAAAIPGGEGPRPCLNRHGAFLGGAPLLAKDSRGFFAPLPKGELEIVLSAGFGIAADLGSRMRGLAAPAKAMNEGDYALAGIVLAQAQFPALPDRGAATRTQKAAAMLKGGASGKEVLKHILPGCRIPRNGRRAIHSPPKA